MYLSRVLAISFANVTRSLLVQVCGAELLGVRLDRGAWREQSAAPFRAVTTRLLDHILDNGPTGWTRALVDAGSLAHGEAGCIGTCQAQAHALRDALQSRQWAEAEGMSCVPRGTVLAERDLK